MTTEDKQTLGMDDMFAHGNVPVEAPVETPPEPQRETAPVTPAADRARDEQGRFASPEAVKPAPVTPTPAPTPAATPDADPEKQPISRAEFKGYLDEKAKRQREQERADAAEARAAAAEARLQQQQPSQIPSPQDEQAFQNYLQTQLDQTQWNVTSKTSQRFATKEHGADTVEAASKWAMEQNDPLLIAKFRQQDDPYGWLVEQHRSHQITQRVGGKTFEEAAREWALSQGFTAASQTEAPPSQAASPQPASDPSPQAPAPTRSIANATSAGGLQVVPPQGEFAALDLAHKH